jgi:hypothetical protein
VGYSLAAVAVMVVHVAYIVFVIVGGLLSWRWPRFLKPHVAAVVVSAALAFTELECPLTDVEKGLRRLAGETPYDGGFISHYIVEPIHAGGTTPPIRFGLRVAIVSITAVAYIGYVAGHRAGKLGGGRRQQVTGTA